MRALQTNHALQGPLGRAAAKYWPAALIVLLVGALVWGKLAPEASTTGAKDSPGKTAVRDARARAGGSEGSLAGDGAGTTQPATSKGTQKNAGGPGGLSLGKDDPKFNRISDISRRDDSGPKVYEMLVYTVLLLILGGGGIYLVRRYLPKLRLGSTGQNVSVLETTALGPRKLLHVIQVGKKKLLVSSSRDDIRYLADVTDALEEGCLEEPAGGQADLPADDDESKLLQEAIR